ncbi:IS1478 transposase [uncultured Gammaproteobacteria bacterium]|nr:IS1478 transposase [uncultured Gammaproteobacteria bacterium]
MLTKSSPISTQSNLFHSELFSQLDVKDPLIQLANTINWTVFDDAFEQHYSQDNGRPSKPIRLMVGLLLLKQLENLSDERVVLQFKRNPYYQYFCGYSNYMPGMPCNATELVHFRKRIGVKGFNLIFKMSVALHGKQAQESTVLIDTTVQEKTSPTPPMPNLPLKSSIALTSWQSVMAFNNAEPMLKRLKTAALAFVTSVMLKSVPKPRKL